MTRLVSNTPASSWTQRDGASPLRASQPKLAGRVRAALLGALLSTVTAWSPAQGAPAAQEIYDARGESAEAGFVDLSLGIDAMDCDDWQACTVHASGLFHGQRVALDVFIQAQGRAQGLIVYRSVGAASDALLAALASLYKQPTPRKTFAKSVTAAIVFLGASNGKMDGKVFFAADGPQSDYAELYTNVDRRRRVLEIREKDTEYRANVLKGLSK